MPVRDVFGEAQAKHEGMLLSTFAAITPKKAGFKSFGETWADTTTSHGRLMLTVLGGLAAFERDLTRARIGEGRARGMALPRGQVEYIPRA